MKESVFRLVILKESRYLVNKLQLLTYAAYPRLNFHLYRSSKSRAMARSTLEASSSPTPICTNNIPMSRSTLRTSTARKISRSRSRRRESSSFVSGSFWTGRGSWPRLTSTRIWIACSRSRAQMRRMMTLWEKYLKCPIIISCSRWSKRNHSVQLPQLERWNCLLIYSRLTATFQLAGAQRSCSVSSRSPTSSLKIHPKWPSLLPSSKAVTATHQTGRLPQFSYMTSSLTHGVSMLWKIAAIIKICHKKQGQWLSGSEWMQRVCPAQRPSQKSSSGPSVTPNTPSSSKAASTKCHWPKAGP